VKKAKSSKQKRRLKR